MSAPLHLSRVLVAVDFGDASAAALALAGDLAKASGARLTVLHAETLEMPPYFTAAQIDRLEAERRDARDAAAEYVRRFAAAHAPVPVEAVVVDGPPAEAVLRLAPEFDLVVLGTHGRRGPRRWWLGSVAEEVVRSATVPVLITRMADPMPSHGEARRLMIAIAGEPTDASGRWAELLREALHATVVHATDVHGPQGSVHPILFVPGGSAPPPDRRSS